jgi:hypothetical protein
VYCPEFPEFPLGTLIGWAIGSIADLATGQSVSPPGVIGLGTDIFGSIAGSVNNGQPWDEQWSIGGGGSLNTGTVFGSGNTGPFIFSFEDQQQQYLNGRLLLPNGDVAIWGIGGGQGGAVLKAAGRRAAHDLGCVVPGFGAGSAGGGLVLSGQPNPGFKSPVTGALVGGSKPFATPGASAGSSTLSSTLRDALPQRLPFRVPTPVGGPGTGRAFGVQATKSLGAAVGRWAPFLGWAGVAYGAYQVNSCLGAK